MKTTIQILLAILMISSANYAHAGDYEQGKADLAKDIAAEELVIQLVKNQIEDATFSKGNHGFFTLGLTVLAYKTSELIPNVKPRLSKAFTILMTSALVGLTAYEAGQVVTISDKDLPALQNNLDRETARLNNMKNVLSSLN